ncbi:hypothetical protein Clacol_008453 [Clathrus columnatus]|uniref:NAD(P)-binding protein n=1 Tax=Clathrus columnatus TaxID=1419009 RepID=A0AAV5AHR7_9AGAM|nr:hypothetical protein Clacol_008453 [Clathrus columnatus]
MGSIFSAIGRGINAIISAIAGVIETIVSAITSVIVTIFRVIEDILCCRCCGSRRRSGGRRGRTYDFHFENLFAGNMPIWLVTGSSRGIGLEFVRQIAQNGDEVIAAARNPENSEALQILSKSFPHISLIKMDIDDPESIKTAAQEVEKILQGRGLDYLINNAAKGGNDKPSEIDPERFFSFMRSNCLGPTLVWQALIPALERSTRPEGPVVVNMTTGLASFGLDIGVKNACYSTSKTALNMMTYKKSKEKPNMIIFIMDPGWVKTDMGGEGAMLEIPFSVSEQYKQAVNATSKDSGTFKRYDGAILPW